MQSNRTSGLVPLTPGQIREELLSQHECLRERLGVLRALADRWARGLGSRDEVRNELAGLLDALRVHNVVEERTLRELVRAVDAWGPERVQVMDVSHVGEHRDVFEAIHAFGLSADAATALWELERLATNLLQWMDEEEAAFLNESVLRDDLVAIDAQGG